MIRAGAALLVVFFHLGYWIWHSDPQAAVPLAYRPFQPFFAMGWVGVEIFFVISGFVIAYSTQHGSPARFFEHRAMRLFPAALICASLTGAVLLTAYPFPTVGLQWLRSVGF